MPTPKKTEWNPRISLDEAHKCALDWLIRARQKNALAQLPPMLYTAYMTEDCPQTQFFHGISSIFRYSTKDTPEDHRARDTLLRLLSVALKAHYFLAPDALVRHEPYFFSAPDISRLSEPQWGLIYRLEGRTPQTIMVATQDLSQMTHYKQHEAIKFPVVLTQNSYKWLDRKHWGELAKEAKLLDQIMKPWIQKQEHHVVDQWTKENEFPFGTVLEVPYEIKDFMKPTGARWAEGLKKWYLPKGFDVDPVKEYQQWVEHEYKTNRNELLASLKK